MRPSGQGCDAMGEEGGRSATDAVSGKPGRSWDHIRPHDITENPAELRLAGAPPRAEASRAFDVTAAASTLKPPITNEQSQGRPIPPGGTSEPGTGPRVKEIAATLFIKNLAGRQRSRPRSRAGFLRDIRSISAAEMPFAMRPLYRAS